MKLTLPKKDKTFDLEVNRVLNQMKEMNVDSKEYTEAVKNLSTLCEARSEKSSSHISADTIIMASANIIGIFAILYFEKWDVVTSKALGFVLKGKA